MLNYELSHMAAIGQNQRKSKKVENLSLGMLIIYKNVHSVGIW